MYDFKKKIRKIMVVSKMNHYTKMKKKKNDDYIILLDYITIKECPREFLFLKINYKILL